MDEDATFECLTCGERLEGETAAFDHTLLEHSQAGEQPEDRFERV